MYHLYKTEFLNHNQFGFIPQKSTTDAATTVKGAFDAAWWPVILRGLREAECPRNLYQLTQDYFKDRRAVMLINSRKID